LEEAVSLIKQNTRHYAKRQITWMNKNENLVWIDDDYKKRILDVYAGIKI
jgi:tRNA dimethylallyltransferase